MKIARAVAPSLLILALSACSGPALPFQAKTDPSVAAIQSAYSALMDNYVDPPSSALLLEGAYQGARQVLANQGIQDNELPAPGWDNGQSSANWDRFSKAYDQVAARYAGRVGSSNLEYAAINGMASSLNDCQTRYYPPAALQQRQAEVNGQQQFGGIGVLMRNIPDHPTVLRVLDGPARSSGLQPGDEIVAVDGKSTAGQTFEDVRNSIRGPEGQPVKITVKRPGTSGTLDFSIPRAQIQAPIIDAAILGGSIGYIHLYSFPANIAGQIDNALSVMDQRSVDSVIFDVRANTGGDQQAILQVLSRFVKGGATVETQIERSGQKTPYTVDGSSYWKNPKPLVVLADNDTQSGGEMFAKAMQEEGGYPVIGMPTSGCAASGHMFDLGDGSGLEISVGKIVSGRGADINRVGVKPDQQVDYPVSDLAAGNDPQLAAAITAMHAGATGQPQTAQPQPRPSTAAQPAAAPTSNNGTSPLIKPLVPSTGTSILK